jgi:hypothetical protein
MNDNFIEKWRDLKRTLTVTQESFLLCSAEDINEAKKFRVLTFPVVIKNTLQFLVQVHWV